MYLYMLGPLVLLTTGYDCVGRDDSLWAYVCDCILRFGRECGLGPFVHLVLSACSLVMVLAVLWSEDGLHQSPELTLMTIWGDGACHCRQSRRQRASCRLERKCFASVARLESVVFWNVGACASRQSVRCVLIEDALHQSTREI